MKRVKDHSYQLSVSWAGNDGNGTKSYGSYRRDYLIESPGKASIKGSSDPAFRGDPSRYNPEELLVASLSSCHLLWYLHLCSASGVIVVGYEDEAHGTMAEDENGSGKFVRVELNPKVTISSGSDPETALLCHEKAHHACFIANSVNFPVDVTPQIFHEAPAVQP